MLEFLISCSLSNTCAVGFLVCLSLYWLIRRHKYNYPPSPKGLPLVGNIFQVDRGLLHEQAFEWSKELGPVITVRLGPTSLIIVNGIDAALEVLVKRSTDFAGRTMTESGALITYGGKDIAFGSYGPVWKLQRKIASKALRHYMLGNALEQRIHGAVKSAFAEIDNISGEFDPVPYIGFIIGNILTGLCFGGTYDYSDKEVITLMKKRDVIIERYGIGPWEDFIPGLKYVYKTDVYREFETFVNEMMEGFIRRKLKEAKKSFNKDNIRHFADTLFLAELETMKEEEGEKTATLSEDHLLQTLADVFFGGTDTSRLTIKGAILHMIAFPDIQAKVQQEIDRVVGKNRLPSVKDRKDLSYTDAVLHESLRFGSVLPLGFQHMTLCDTKVAGYRIPKGELVSINIWGLHNDSEAWRDVDRFIPERFLDESGKLGPKPNNWLPFSAGTRVCLGEFVAKPTLHLIFASLMQRYCWKMVSGKCADLTRCGGAFGLTYKPFNVIVEKRI